MIYMYYGQVNKQLLQNSGSSPQVLCSECREGSRSVRCECQSERSAPNAVRFGVLGRVGRVGVSVHLDFSLMDVFTNVRIML